jgi:Rrf2 family protein
MDARPSLKEPAMPTSSRFAVAVHALTHIAAFNGQPVTSGEIAKSANTNPSVIRRILAMLNDAGLTHAQLGQGGGALLARPAGEITLLDVYRAVESETLFAMHRSAPNPGCPIGHHIQPALASRLDRATDALERELGATTIADVAGDVLARHRGSREPA